LGLFETDWKRSSVEELEHEIQQVERRIQDIKKKYERIVSTDKHEMLSKEIHPYIEKRNRMMDYYVKMQTTKVDAEKAQRQNNRLEKHVAHLKKELRTQGNKISIEHQTEIVESIIEHQKTIGDNQKIIDNYNKYYNEETESGQEYITNVINPPDMAIGIIYLSPGMTKAVTPTRNALQYNTFYKYELKSDKYFASDSVQFRLANKELIKRMLTDRDFRISMLRKNPQLLEWMNGKPNLSKSPPKLTWHHDEKKGILKLVNRNDHAKNHGVYHPTGNGGRDIWGGGNPGRTGKLDSKGKLFKKE